MGQGVAGAVKGIAGKVVSFIYYVSSEVYSPVPMVVPPKHNSYVCSMVVVNLDKLQVGVWGPVLPLPFTITI